MIVKEMLSHQIIYDQELDTPSFTPRQEGGDMPAVKAEYIKASTFAIIKTSNRFQRPIEIHNLILGRKEQKLKLVPSRALPDLVCAKPPLLPNQNLIIFTPGWELLGKTNQEVGNGGVDH